MPLAPAGGAWDWRRPVEVVDLDSPKLLMVGNKLRPMIVRSCHLVQTIWGGGGRATVDDHRLLGSGYEWTEFLW